RQNAADDLRAQLRRGDATGVRRQFTALEAASAIRNDIQAFNQVVRQELVAGVFRTRLGVAGRQVVAPFRDKEVTLEADDVAVETLLLRRGVVAEADEGANADVGALVQALITREGAEGQVRGDQRAALGVVKRQLTVTRLRRPALVQQEFAIA